MHLALSKLTGPEENKGTVGMWGFKTRLRAGYAPYFENAYSGLSNSFLVLLRFKGTFVAYQDFYNIHTNNLGFASQFQ